MFDVSLIYASIIGLIDTTKASASANRISKLNFLIITKLLAVRTSVPAKTPLSKL